MTTIAIELICGFAFFAGVGFWARGRKLLKKSIDVQTRTRNLYELAFKNQADAMVERSHFEHMTEAVAAKVLAGQREGWPTTADAVKFSATRAAVECGGLPGLTRDSILKNVSFDEKMVALTLRELASNEGCSSEEKK